MAETKAPLSVWGKEIVELLAANRKHQKDVAEALGVEKATLHEFIHSKNPRVATIKRVNEAVASVIGDPAVAGYLAIGELIRRLESGLPISFAEFKRSFSEMIDEADLLSPYLRPGYRDYINRELSKKWKASDGSGKGLLQLALAVQKVERSYYLDLASGKSIKQRRSDLVMGKFREHGIDLTRWKRPENEVRARRAADDFCLALSTILDNKDEIGSPLTSEQRAFFGKKIQAAFAESHRVIQSSHRAECAKLRDEKVAVMDELLQARRGFAEHLEEMRRSHA